VTARSLAPGVSARKKRKKKTTRKKKKRMGASARKKLAAKKRAATTLANRVERCGYALGNNRWKERVRLSALRAILPGVTRRELDRVLLEMQRADRLVLYRLDNPRELTPADKAAAMDVGGYPRHLVYFLGPASKSTAQCREAGAALRRCRTEKRE
jgi:hypothetical protein